MKATTLITRARVITMNPEQPEAAAVAVRDDRILAVGDIAELQQFVDSSTTVFDAGGRIVLPGLIDAHTHLELTAIAQHVWLDVRGLGIEATLDRLAEHITTLPEGEWVIAQGTWGQVLPDKAQLDRVSRAHPIVVRGNVHLAVANTRALTLAGIDPQFAPPAGVRVHRTAQGEPTGVIEEGFDLFDWPKPSQDTLKDAVVRTSVDLFRRFGITTIYDVPATSNGVRAYGALGRAGELPTRLRLQLTVPPGNQPLAPVGHLADLGIVSGFGDDHLSIGGIKIFVDGYGPGAWSRETLADEAEGWGLPTRTYQDLVSDVLAAAKAGLSVWLHAAGDLAQEMAISALERVVQAYPRARGTLRVEHIGNTALGVEHMRRMRAADLLPVPNPTFLFAEPASEPVDGMPGRYAMRTLIDAGFTPPGNSDTAGTQPFAANPWFGISCMVTRRNRDGATVSASEAVTVDEALRAYTIDAARSGGEAEVKGSIEPGKLADLVVLADDPRTLDPARLADIVPDAVMIDGAFV